MDTAAPAIQHAHLEDNPADACQTLWQQLQQLVQSREAQLAAQEQDVQQKAHRYQQIEHLLSSLWQHVQSLTISGQVLQPSLAGLQPEEVSVQLLQTLLLQVTTPSTHSNQQPQSAPDPTAAAATHSDIKELNQLPSDPQQQQLTAVHDEPAMVHNRAPAAVQIASGGAAETAQGHQGSGVSTADDSALLKQQRILSRLGTLGGKLRHEQKQLRILQQQMAADLQQAHHFAAFLQSDTDVAGKFRAWREQQGLVAAQPQGEHQQQQQQQQQAPRCCTCGGLQLQPSAKYESPRPDGVGVNGKKKNKKRKNAELQQVQQQERAQGKASKKQKGPKHKQQQQPLCGKGATKQYQRDGTVKAACKRATQQQDDGCTAVLEAHVPPPPAAAAAAPAGVMPCSAQAAAAAADQAKAVASADGNDLLGQLYELQERQQNDLSVGGGGGACQQQQQTPEAAATEVKGKTQGEQQAQQQEPILGSNTGGVTTSMATTAAPAAEHDVNEQPQVLLTTDVATGTGAQLPGAAHSSPTEVASAEGHPHPGEQTEARAQPKQHMFKPIIPRLRRPPVAGEQQEAQGDLQPAAAAASAGLDSVAAADEDDPFELMNPEERVAALGERGEAPANAHAAEDKRRRQKQYFAYGGARRAGIADAGQQQQLQGKQSGPQGSGQTPSSPPPAQQQVWQQPNASEGAMLAEQRQQQHQQFLQQFSHYGQQAAAAQQHQQQHQVSQLQLPGKPWLQPLQQQQQQQHYPQHYHQHQQQQRAAHKEHGALQQQQQRTHYHQTSHQQKAYAQQRHHPTKHVLPMGAASALNTRRHHTHHGTQTAAAAANGHGGGFGVVMAGYGRAREEDASEQELAAMVEELRQAAG